MRPPPPLAPGDAGTVLVAGAGLAGSRCAEALRAAGYAGRLVVVGEEPTAPYSRPALSKEFLRGDCEAASLLLRPHGHWAGLDIDLRVDTRVETVDTARRTARIGSDEIAWDALVLATGARSRRLPLELPPGVHLLRTLRDALSLRRSLRPGTRLVVVGAGLIGTEVASTARSLGVDVAVVSPEPPLRAAVGAEVSALLAARYRGFGVELADCAVAGFRARRGRVCAVDLADGRELACDAALVAVGAEPVTGLVPGSPGGIETDVDGRTAYAGVYACGDVASCWSPAVERHVRFEHWTSASEQADRVAAAITGNEPRPPSPPYFWSDQFGLRLQVVGHSGAAARVEINGGDDDFRADYLAADGSTVATLLANRPAELGAVRRRLAA